MRRVTRPALPTKAQAYLDKRQLAAHARRALGTLDIERVWKGGAADQGGGGGAEDTATNDGRARALHVLR